MNKPTKAQLLAEAERLRTDYADACRALQLCRDALRRERATRREQEAALAAIAGAREPVERTALLRLAGREFVSPEPA